MDIIVVSDRFEQARSFKLTTPQVLFLGLLFLLMVLSLSVLLNYFSLRYAVTHKSPYLQSMLAAVQEEQTRRTQSYVRESLDTMAARVGEMGREDNPCGHDRYEEPQCRSFGNDARGVFRNASQPQHAPC